MSISPPPVWNLSDLYQGVTDPALANDLSKAAVDAKAFRTKWQGHLSGETLARALQEYDALSECLGKALTYTSLLYAADTENPEIAALYQNSHEQATALQQDVLFFELELCLLEDSALEGQDLHRWKPWLDSVRAMRPHQLSEEQEQLLNEKQLTSRSAWSRLFDETMTAMRFELNGKEHTEAEILHLLSTSPDREVRRDAGRVFASNLDKHSRLFTLLTNTLAKDKEIEDRWRKFPHPLASRNLSNQMDDATVTALVQAVRAAYPRLAHRYYALKAKWLGLERLEYWDRNAPLPESDGRVFSWEEAARTVESAYRAFSPTLADIGKTFFENPWIDAAPRAGKDSGAFAHPCIPSVHPYLLMNYQGKTRDIMTLAHELGHGVHQVLAGHNGYLLSQTPLTLAETASVFGEMLTFQSLLQQTTDPTARKVLLAGKVEDMLNTVVRQIAFHCFEEAVHRKRQAGELSTDALCNIWMQVQQESLGAAVHLAPEYRMFWAYIPHFIHSPFYVYAYAFGDCLVNALYAVYQHKPDGFAAKYQALLAAGGTVRYDAALKAFDLDPKNPEFWQGGLQVIEAMITELEGM